jgi:dethiobiotin synthetase
MKGAGGDHESGPAKTLFITGTDTGVGKTTLATGLLRAARHAGSRVAGYKPVASGSRRTAAGLRNADALALQRAADTREPYERINPYAFAPPIAPHLAARAAGRRIDLRRLDAAQAVLAERYEWLLVEGAGGWQVPLTAETTMADWVARRGWPVVLVVGLRLGCLNHALLTAESINRRTRLLGWVANPLRPVQPAMEQNIKTLRRLIPAPCLGVMPLPDRADAAEFLKIFRRISKLL